MATTIQVSDKTKEILDTMKLFHRDTYNEIIERMLEDNLELNEKTKKEIEERIRHGKTISHEEAKKRLGL